MSDVAELRAQDVKLAASHETAAYYADSKEYTAWRAAEKSAFLWFIHHPEADLLAEMSSIVCSLDESQSDSIAKVAYFCPKTPLKPLAVLRSMVLQLGRSSAINHGALHHEQSRQIMSIFRNEDFSPNEELWSLFESLLQRFSNQDVYLILGGIDSLNSEDLKVFTRRLRRIWSTKESQSASVSSRHSWLKVLISSGPNQQLADTFKSEPSVDPDKERRG